MTPSPSEGRAGAATAPASTATQPDSTAPDATAPVAPVVRRAERPEQGAAAQGAQAARAEVPADRAEGGDPARKQPKRVLGYRRQRFEARKVRRLVRHLDPWSVLKLSILVALCMWLITMIAAVILWTVASNSGTITSVEEFVNSSLQLQDWKLDGEFLFRQFGLISLLLALGMAAAMVIATLVFNLISDIIGGVWLTVIEEESARPVGDDGT